MTGGTACLASIVALLALGACASPPPHQLSPLPSASAPSSPRERWRTAPPTLKPAAPAPLGQVVARRLAWTLPSALSREVVISEGESAVVAGGLLRGDLSSDRVFRITGEGGVVSRMASLAQPLHDSAGVRVGGQLLVVGGGGAAELSSIERLGGDHRWHLITHLPSSRSDLSVVTLSDGFLVVGGYDGARSQRDVLRSRDGRSFTLVGQLRRGVRYAATVRVGPSVWVFGGEDQQRELRTVQRIDAATGSGTVAAQLPRALGHSAAALIGSRILLMGGRTSPDRVTDQMWWFDPGTRRFTRAGKLPYPVADAGLFISASRAYLLGGETPGFTDRVTRVELTR